MKIATLLARGDRDARARADVGTPTEIKEGHLLLPTGPGWGTDVNEAAVRAHPPRKQ
jgi:L-alanine-DL-glutamate epimerase-like enolase superfamily enzyme